MIPANRAWDLAAKIKVLPDIELPVLEEWNYRPCKRHAPAIDSCQLCGPTWRCDEHTKSTSDCRLCGVILRAHQRVGAAWSYTVTRGLLADSVGTGKTAQILTNLAIRRQREESHLKSRAVIVVKPQALRQWAREFNRMLPTVPLLVSVGDKAERMSRYVSPWEVCLISVSTFISRSEDWEKLMKFPVGHLYIDDVDGLRHYENKTAYTIKKMAERVESVMVCTGTPLQKRLHELYSVLELMGGYQVFGPRPAFENRYVRKEPVTKWTPRGRKVVATKVVGYKNLEEFKKLVEPFALRRTVNDIDDVQLPEVVVNHVELELYPAQRARYLELRRGVIKIIKEQGAKVSQATAMGKLHTGARICAGIGSLDGIEADAPDTSVKMDWLMEKLSGDLSDDKVVIFAAYKDTIRLIQHRLANLDDPILQVTLWGDEPDKDLRERRIDQFWEDPDTKVLIGTQAIEQSLNLQVAKHLINIDQILNPSRMEQLSGRIRRMGSAHTHVYIHNLTTLDTQEAGYMPLLEREQALIDYVWDESSELFEKLSPLALLQLIGNS